MNEETLTEKEIEFVQNEIQKYCDNLTAEVKAAIEKTERDVANEAEIRGLSYPVNPANSGFLKAMLIQELLDDLCSERKEFAVHILTNEANRLGVKINMN
ncbi:hypothetical protein M3A07_25725 [Klebsiella pneumoniae]|uniref:hypothetical protein n=1 Tax=Klebsiella pneumoniae TaxID=573 RepID=UPI00200E3483|nr:hypothetical protein [Klebsiella pneumoniae]MCL0703355.1 hypothetical protein [Klebsiella pneumoniae]